MYMSWQYTDIKLSVFRSLSLQDILIWDTMYFGTYVPMDAGTERQARYLHPPPPIPSLDFRKSQIWKKGMYQILTQKFQLFENDSCILNSLNISL